MSDTGQRWVRTTIGELIALDYGRALADTVRSGEGYPVYGSSGLVGHNSKALVDGPGIVVGRKGTVGAVTWSPERFWPIDTTYYVRWLDERTTDRRWTYWTLKSLPLKRLDSSTGVPGLNRNDAYRLSVQLPPIAEQRRIGEILDTADETIRSTERLIAKLELAKQGLLHDILTRGVWQNLRIGSFTLRRRRLRGNNCAILYQLLRRSPAFEHDKYREQWDKVTWHTSSIPGLRSS